MRPYRIMQKMFCGFCDKNINMSVFAFRKQYNFRSEKWAVTQLFVQKNGLDSCFFVWKSVPF